MLHKTCAKEKQQMDWKNMHIHSMTADGAYGLNLAFL